MTIKCINLYRFLIVAILLAVSTSLYAQDFVEYFIGYTIISSTERTVEATRCVYVESSGIVNIPETVTNSNNGRTYTVVGIGEYAFFDQSASLKEIYLPNTITYIADNAFYNCQLIEEELTLPQNLTTIGAYAFYQCSRLKGELTIPDSVIDIGDGAFVGCSQLTSLTLSNSITSIGYRTFESCSGFTGKLKIPDSVTTIEKYAFSGCKGFNSISFNKNLTIIDEFAFSNCSGLSAEVTIPNSVTTIGKYAFSNCSNIYAITLGDNVEKIESYTFYACSNLNIVTLNENLTTIDNYAFRDCTTLRRIYSFNPEPPTCTTYAFYNVDIDKCFLYVPKEAVSTYQKDDVWKKFYVIRPFFSIDEMYDELLTEIATAQELLDTSWITITTNYTTVAEDYLLGYNTFTSNLTTLVNDVNDAYNNGTLDYDVFDDTYASLDILTNDINDWLSLAKQAQCNYDWYQMLRFDINTYENDLQQKWATITTDCANVADKFTTTYQTLYDELEQVRDDVIEAYNNGIIDDNVANQFGDILIDICTRINALLDDARQAEEIYTLYISILSDCDNDSDTLNSLLAQLTTKYPSITDDITALYNSYAEDIDNLISNITNDFNNDTLTSNSINKYLDTLHSIEDNINALPTKVKEIYLSTIICIKNIYYDILSATNKTVVAVYGEPQSEIDNYMVLPETINYDNDTYTVAAIAGDPFTNDDTESIYLPATITSIGSECFTNCTALTTIICPWDNPNTVTALTTSFDGTYSSATLFVPLNTIASYQTTDPWSNFSDIQEYDLTDGYLRYSVSSGAGVLNDWQDTSLTGHINVAENVVKDGRLYKVTTIRQNAFRECQDITSVTFPNTITDIGEYVFYCCYALQEVNIPDGVTTISRRLFSNCTSLNTFTIHNNITAIGESAFAECTALQDIVLGTNVNFLDSQAFIRCTALATITSLNPEPPTINETRVFSNVDKENCIVYVPKGTKRDYAAAEGWNEFYKIYEDITIEELYNEILDEIVATQEILNNA